MGTIKVDFGNRMRPPQIDPRLVGLVLLVLFVALLAFQTVFTVEPEEVALIQRFGEYQRTNPTRRGSNISRSSK